MAKVEVNSIGSELRLIRTKRRQSLLAISELTGISENYISEIERDVKYPTNDKFVYALAKAYDMDPMYLFRKFGRLPDPVLEEVNRHEALQTTLLRISNDGTLSEDKKQKLYDQFKALYDEALG